MGVFVKKIWVQAFDLDCSADEQVKNEVRTELRSHYMSSWKSSTNSISVYAPQTYPLQSLFPFWH